MFHRIIFSFIFSCILFLNFAPSHLLQENTDTHKHPEKTLYSKRRLEIAEEYMNKLAERKENWIDPYEMIGYPVQQRGKPSAVSKDKQNEHVTLDEDSKTEPTNIPKEPNRESNEQIDIPRFSPPYLDNDEKPTFSDIKGDIINEKIFMQDETMLDIDVDSGGRLTKGRQQICVLDSIYISRWLKKLVLKIEKESSLVPSAVNFPIDHSMFNNLKELSTAKSLEISQLDELICKMIDHSSIIRIEDFDWTVLSDYAKDLMWPVIIFVAVAICVCTIYQGILHRPVFTTLCCVVIISVFWHWMHLYKQRQALKLAELSTMTVPTQCQKSEFGLFEHLNEYLKSFFTSNECAKYYEALTVDPFWEISITVAASEAVTSVLFQPLSASSRYINLAIKQLFDGLSIFTVIPVLVFIFLILIMFCNYRIRFPFFMGALEPHCPSTGNHVQELNYSKPLKTLADVIKCKLSVTDDSMSSQKSLMQDTDEQKSTCEVSEKCINQKSIQNFSEQSSCLEVKDLRLERLKDLPSRISSVDQSASEDDISIIDSEESNTDTENSFMEQILPGCQQNCQCCFPVEYLSNTDCKACGDNLASQSMDDSSLFSSGNYDLEDRLAKQ